MIFIWLAVLTSSIFIIFNGDPISPAEVIAGVNAGMAIAGLIDMVLDAS